MAKREKGDGRAADALKSWGLPGRGQRGGIQSALSVASGGRGRASPGLEPEAWFPTADLELTPAPPNPTVCQPLAACHPHFPLVPRKVQGWRSLVPGLGQGEPGNVRGQGWRGLLRPRGRAWTSSSRRAPEGAEQKQPCGSGILQR